VSQAPKKKPTAAPAKTPKRNAAKAYRFPPETLASIDTIAEWLGSVSHAKPNATSAVCLAVERLAEQIREGKPPKLG
jgi:hypothetical protein